MTTIREKTFSVGKYLVSPLTRRTDHGEFAASVSIRSGRGSGTHDRVFRFVPHFPTRAGARRYAVAEGLRWLSGRVASRPPESDPNQEPAWPRKN